ncbi:chemotaxis protein CheA [Actinomycetaceae bacterium L2_0104]
MSAGCARSDNMEVPPVDDMDEIVQEFLVESHENLDQLDQDLVALESQPGSRDLLSSIFRTVHTIKGTSGFLGLDALESVSHAGEGLLSELRDGIRTMTPATTDVLLSLVDTIRAMLASIESGDGDAAVDSSAVRAAIASILQGEEGPPHQLEGEFHQQPRNSEPKLDADVVAAAEPSETGRPIAPDADESLTDLSPAVSAQTPATADNSEHAGEDHPAVRSAADSSVRVDVGLLDALMRQVGELVLVRNQIERLIELDQNIDLQRAGQSLNLISSELQEGVMKTRMQPIDHLWSKMPRVVRDLSKALGRETHLVMEGRETELDRSLLEAVKDPLTHLVRNAVDHGIETPAKRVAAGKSPVGTVTLSAYHAGGQVVVEISDDGKGIDPDAVAATAIKRSILTPELARKLSTSEIFDLLFQPGFSTAEKVTNVSGRGVGMDVVRSKVESIGGTVDVDSRLGEGTTWRLRIPLTLAIMPALTVECGDEVFAVAQVNLLELVAIQDRDDDAHVEYVGSAPVYRLRGALLPIVSLAEVLGLEPGTGAAVIAVIQADEHRFGLMVDRVINTEEIVVKALSGRIKQIGLYSGATVLGDGNVALILDVQAVARRALAGEVGDLIRVRAAAVAAEAAQVEQEQLLVVAIGDGRRVALPLDAVTRLERMPAARIEHVGHREVIQYRGDLLPLARLDRILGSFGGDEPEDMLVVVLRGTHGEQLAVVVAQILDIVEHDPGARSELDDTGLLGSTVVSERVTELLDVDSLIASMAAMRTANAGGLEMVGI